MLWDLRQDSEGLTASCKIFTGQYNQEAKNLDKKYTSAYLSRLNANTSFEKDPMESLLILEKILQDDRQNPMQLL